MGQEKQKKGEGEKVKSKSQDCCVTFKPKNLKFCFLHIPPLHKLDLDHKAAKCTPFK